MKTFLLISAMLIASLFVESRTVPDVHIRGVDMVQVQALDVVTIQLVETAEPAPVHYVTVPSTLEGYSNVVNPPPSITSNQFEYNRHRDVWKWPLNDIAILPKHNNYNFTASYQRLCYHDYRANSQANVTQRTSIALKRYPSTKARMC